MIKKNRKLGLINGVVGLFVILASSILIGSNNRPQTEDIVIMFTNDVASEIDGNIGYAGVKSFKDELQSEYQYVSLVDAGDFLDGDIARVSKGKLIIDLMNAVGYDVVTLGNQEFSMGLDTLKENIGNSDFEYVSCNLEYIGHGKDRLKRVQPYVIKRYGGTKIAYIGVTTPETILKVGKPAYEALREDGEFIYTLYEGNEGQDLYNRVQKTIDKVKNKVDYVVVLAHLGQNSVMSGFSSYDLIENTSGIDVVIDAHSHTANTGEAVADKDGHNVILTSAQEELKYVGVVYIHPDRTYTTVLYPSVRSADPEIQNMVNEIHQNTGY